MAKIDYFSAISFNLQNYLWVHKSLTKHLNIQCKKHYGPQKMIFYFEIGKEATITFFSISKQKQVINKTTVMIIHTLWEKAGQSSGQKPGLEARA